MLGFQAVLGFGNAFFDGGKILQKPLFLQKMAIFDQKNPKIFISEKTKALRENLLPTTPPQVPLKNRLNILSARVDACVYEF